MKKLSMALILSATLLYFSGIPALAQRGRGAGAGSNPGGGPPSLGSGSQGGFGASGAHGGMPGAQVGQGTRRPEPAQPDKGRSQRGPEDRTTGPAESKPDSGQRTAAEHLAINSKLSSKVGSLFPAGTNLQQQAAGFKNLGEFVSTAHVSHNLGIPFDQLRTRMAGGKSLGDAIHDLKPDVDHRAEERKARQQARKDLQETGS